MSLTGLEATTDTDTAPAAAAAAVALCGGRWCRMVHAAERRCPPAFLTSVADRRIESKMAGKHGALCCVGLRTVYV